MKKIAGLLMAASMISMVACGPSEEEKKKQDAIEIKKANAAADSLVQAMHDDGAKKDTTKKADAPKEEAKPADKK